MAIIAGLNMSPISRLKKTVSLLSFLILSYIHVKCNCSGIRYIQGSLQSWNIKWILVAILVVIEVP